MSVLAAVASSTCSQRARALASVNVEVRDGLTWREWFAFSPGNVVTGLGMGLYHCWKHIMQLPGMGLELLVVVVSSCLGAVTEGQFICSFLACGGQERCCVFSHHPLLFLSRWSAHWPVSDLLLPSLLHTLCFSFQPVL